MEFVALLPMKEHSERVPRKNFRKLAGKPLFFYIADTLEKSKIFRNLVINTDSHKISEMAKNRYGEWVVIHKRPKELCGDFTSMNSVIEYDINILGPRCHFFQTHSTNPFLSLKTIQMAVKDYRNKVVNGKHDSMFSVDILQTRLYDKKLRPINHDPNSLLRTQDLDIIYEENSNFYFFTSESFNGTKARIGNEPAPFLMASDRINSLDIDSMKDWNFAEKIIAGNYLNTT